MLTRLLLALCALPSLLLASPAGAESLIEFEPFQPAGWAAALVPRAAADGHVVSCPAPSTLPGGLASTYLNLVTRNNSPVDGLVPFHVQVELDGELLYGSDISPYWANLSWTLINRGPYTVPAGRHTLVLIADALDSYVEADESNNIFGAQWVWEPSTLPFGSTFSRPAPVDASAGLDQVAAPTWPNCDGVRAPTFSQIFNGYWDGFAVMPGNASDVDLRLHLVSTGATDGFDLPLADSAWGVGESEFVFVNLNHAGAIEFDAGIRKVSGSQNYSIHLLESTLSNLQINGLNPDYAITTDGIARLHEVYLYPGVYVISLENKTPTVKLGFGLYGPVNSIGEGYFGKSDTVTPDAISLDPAAGPLQYLTVEILPGDEDFYCVAVFKNGAADLPNDASYTVHLRSGATPTDDEIPSREPRLSVYPNPFNPRTNVSFELARQDDVTVELFDLRGARVRTIELGRMPAGQHSFQLDASDQRGGPLASGRYLLQLIAGEQRSRQAITLLK